MAAGCHFGSLARIRAQIAARPANQKNEASVSDALVQPYASRPHRRVIDSSGRLRRATDPSAALPGLSRGDAERNEVSSLSNLLRGVVYEYIVTPGRVGRKATVTLRLSKGH